MLIKLEKISASDNPNAYAPADWKKYKIGQINETLSIPIDYCIEGCLIGNLFLDEPIKVNRTKRNGVECLGIFQSSPITNIIDTNKTEKLIETNNSIYRLTFLEE